MKRPQGLQPRRITILMPALNPAMKEGILARWHKRPGEMVRYGDVVAEIDTPFAIMEVEAVDEGLVEKVLVEEGTTVQVNTPIATILEIAEDVRDAELAAVKDWAQRNPLLSVPTATRPARTRPKPRKIERKVFIVHGHDEAARYATAEFLRKADFEPIVLHERPNKGRTIISKFREEADGVGFAVVLMTPDDVGAKPGDDLRPRARQNVVFELGFFVGALGPERVAALVKGQVERPSDFDGVVYIDMDSAGAWKATLVRELEAAGYKVDWNKVMRP